MRYSMRFSVRFSKPFMAGAAALAIASIVSIVSLASLGCRDMRPRSQEWVVCAPENAIMGVSLHLGWALERPEVRGAIAEYPILDQTLEILLDKVKMDPTSETGRVSVYVLDVPGPSAKTASLDDLRGMALMQLAGFRDPKAVQRVIVENFPPEGSLRVGGREYPLFVLLDINSVRLRVFLDGDDRLWMGDVTALQGAAKRRFVGESGPPAKAAEWIQPSSAVQGFVQPDLVPREALGDLADAIPAGVKGLAWSISTMENDPRTVSLSLAATGTEKAIAAVKPWMQRLAAAASAVAGDGTPPPETLQEKTRMGLKCQLGREQMDRALEMMKLDQAIALPPGVMDQKPGAAK